MAKIKIDMDKLCEAYPEARMLEVLPRKKKKALKKKIAKMIISALREESFRIMLENDIFKNTYDSLIEEIEKVSDELKKLENGKNV